MAPIHRDDVADYICDGVLAKWGGGGGASPGAGMPAGGATASEGPSGGAAIGTSEDGAPGSAALRDAEVQLGGPEVWLLRDIVMMIAEEAGVAGEFRIRCVDKDEGRS